MKTNVKFLSILLAALVGFSFSSKEAKVANEAEENLVVRHVLRQNATNNEGTVVNTTNAPEANGLVSDVLAQVNTPTNGAVSMRFVAGIDSYAYENAQFNITLKDAEGTVVKAERSYTVSSAYLGVEANNEVKYASDLFGEGYNYLIAYTLTDIPEDYWNYQFDVTAETTQKSLNVATKRVSNYYNVKVNTFKVDGTKLETRYEKVALNEVYTVNAPEVEGLVASHDYVKGYLTEGEMETHNIYYSEVDTWDGTASSGFEGEGTEDSPYLIQSAEDFALLRDQAAAGTAYEGSYFKMTKSVDFGGENFIVSTFAGTFDGNHCSVRGLLLDLNDYAGLFSKTTAGEVKNISTYGEVFGWGTVGSIAGQADGLLTNCTNYATVNGQGNRGGIVGIANAKVTNCVNYGDALQRSGGWTVAALVGVANAEVSYSKNFGRSTGTTTHVGGLIGTANANVRNCGNYGDVEGMTIGAAGLVANVTAGVEISNCINVGNVTLSTTADAWTGSIAGIAGKSAGSKIENCVNYGDINISVSKHDKTTGVGGIAGQNGAIISSCENFGSVITNSIKNTGGVAGETTANITNSINHGDISMTHTTTSQFTFNIGGIAGNTTASISNSINNGNINATTAEDKGKDPVGGIVGTANGEINNCTNKGNVTSNRSYAGGVIGSLQNVNVSGCENYGIVTGTNTVGGIIAAIPWVSGASRVVKDCINYGTVRNSSYFGAGIAATANQVTFSNCENRGDIDATGDNCGGIVAALYSTSTIDNCHNYAMVKGKTNIGGIVAQNGSTISNCTNSGEIVVTVANGVADENGLTGINSLTASGKTYQGVITNCTNTGTITRA